MSSPAKSIKFTGIIPPMVTPLINRDQLDIEGLQQLIEHIIGGGVHGIFVLGTTGEAPSLGYKLRRELIERTCSLVNGRVPVLVGITDTAFTESLKMANHAEHCGADAVVVAPPYYYKTGQPELLEYFQGLISAVPLPVMLYNIPACTKVGIELDTLRHLLDHPNVVGYKDSSGQMAYFQNALKLFADHPEKTLLVGTEEALADTLILGGHGGVTGGANIFPRLYVDLYHAAKAQDLSTVQKLHQTVMQVSQLYHVGRHASSTIKGVKCALSCLGICGDFMTEPFHRYREHERKQVRQILAKLNVTACQAAV